MVRTLMARTLIAALAVAAICSTASANRLANPGFEDPVTSDGPPFVGFWEVFSGDGIQLTGPDVSRNSTLMPRTGLQSLEIIIDDSANTFAGAFQDVPGLSVGDSVRLTGWHKSIADSGGIEIRIEWRDSINDLEISRTPNLTPSPGTTYEMFTLDSVVPAGADSARVVYAIQSFGGAINQQIFVDDMSFVPASLGASKSMTSSTGNALPSMITIDYVLQNFSGSVVNDLSALDDLTASFGVHGIDWIFISISSSANIVHNASFNGYSDTELIEQTGGTEQDLAASAVATVTVVIELLTHAGDAGVNDDLCNQIVVTGDQGGTPVSDLSTDGPEPDPNTDGFPDEMEPSCFSVPVELMAFSVE